jgi:hypothetical protein
MNKSVPTIVIAASIICLPLSAKRKKDTIPAQNLNAETTTQEEENSSTAGVHEQSDGTAQEKQATTKNGSDTINPKTGFPVIKANPYVMFNEGAAFSQVTRIVYQDDYNHSNFVWQNYLAGVY